MNILLLVILIFVLFAVFPRTGAYNANWGYGPSVGGIVIILFVAWLLFFGGLRYLH